VIALLIAAAVSMASSLVGTRLLIKWLQRRSVIQPILVLEGKNAPPHAAKIGTPTMGGVAIVGSMLAGYAVAHFRHGTIFTNTGLIVVLTIFGAATVGFLDDWIKVTNARNLGLSKRMKMLGLLVVAIGFGVLLVNVTKVHYGLAFTRFDNPGWNLHATGWVILAAIMILSTSNAVNVSDGLDGLAAGSAIYGFIAFTVIAFWGFRHPEIYKIDHALDLSVIAVSMAGACAGFLWWNAAPARIFMGDTGSLAIGTGLATLAATTNTQLLLPIVCGLYVAETMSVILQVISYRGFGRRLFAMSPVHHHFELKGWAETTVIIRFWIVAGLLTAVGLGLYYADFVALGAAAVD